MKHFYTLAILLLAIALPQARAQQTPDDQYIAIYAEIQQADSLQGTGQPRQALDAFTGAQADLQKFEKIYPDWNQKIINFRLKYVAEKVAALTALLPPPTNAPAQMEPAAAADANSSAPAAADSQLNGLRAQVQSLQSDNATLGAKLKEALATQPAAVDSGELSKAQAQIQSLMKENDLLKAGQAQASAPNADLTKLQAQVEVDALEKQKLEDRIRQLQSTTATPAAPPSQSEVTLTANTPPATPAPDQSQTVTLITQNTQPAMPPADQAQPAAVPAGAKKSINELPAGSAELVAEAQNYFAARQYDQAAADYRKILQLAPDNALALGNLAAIELEQGDLDNAETHILAAIAKNPEDAYNLSILGYLEFRQQKFDDALDALTRAARLDPKNAEIQNYLGVTLSHKGRHAEAEAALRRAIEIQPDYAAAHNNLAVVYISQQPPSVELARLEYQKAIELGQPHNSDLEKLLANKGAPVKPQ